MTEVKASYLRPYDGAQCSLKVFQAVIPALEKLQLSLLSFMSIDTKLESSDKSNLVEEKVSTRSEYSHSVGRDPFLQRDHLRPLESTDIYIMIHNSGKISYEIASKLT